MSDTLLSGGVPATDPAAQTPGNNPNPNPNPAPPANPADAAPPAEAGKQAEPGKKVKDGKADEAKTGAPENYEDFKMPDGVEVDKEALEAFKPLAKELGLSQEQAQKLIDLQTGFVQKQAEAQQKAWQAVEDGWLETVQKDAEISGDENLAFARKARDAFGSPAFIEMFEATRVGNHPEFVRFLVKVGKAISEDKLHAGGNSPAQKKSAAELIYTSMSN